ncbi:MAG: hypothetical protein DWQ31_19605 [Planctomycetota bacterium]|nr:MAG: hypothetical protein DWQ31_19605 [Planctomycetota bacterium]REJ88746.1 MAG: hypothetical protein DWQ35_19275 [Planctomycetota bacterium]REK26587.1 MAG: hypothetical protein DWQ42_08670 [Planctomycetota bacterium]REK46088.1 MAG: hypothetical protein DWQ46_07195 [Planctomycetota bacterium]
MQGGQVGTNVSNGGYACFGQWDLDCITERSQFIAQSLQRAPQFIDETLASQKPTPFARSVDPLQEGLRLLPRRVGQLDSGRRRSI